MLMALVYKALSEHREAFESTRKAVRFSPEYPAAHYHHARNAALIGDQASCAFSLIEAVRASAHFCVSAMLDNHFDQWRSDVTELIVRTTLSTPLPDSQYHRTWFELSKHCASLGQVEKSINLLEKVISFDPSYYSKAQDAISSFAPLESAIKSFLERLHSNAKTKAKQSIKDAESKLPTVKEFIAEAKLAMEMARDKEQLNSEAAYESAQSSLDLARKKLESENFEELMKIPPIAQEVKISIDSALKTAREEKVFYERRKSQKKSKSWDQLWDELWIPLLFLPVGGMVGSFLFGVFVYPISPEWVDSHSRSFPISGLIAGLSGAVLYKIREAREIMGYDNSNFKSLSYTCVFTLYFLLLFLLKV
jgi:tetratricopeptide (TPR) repeat protein